MNHGHDGSVPEAGRNIRKLHGAEFSWHKLPNVFVLIRVFGEPASSEELEDVQWYRVGQHPLESFRDVTRFMLARAIALHGGTPEGEAPLFYWAKNARRIGVCRESNRDR